MAPRKGVDKAPMRFHQALTLMLGAAGLSACMPLPVHYHTRPDIYGTVARNGMPVEGAKVGYSGDLSDVHCDSAGDPQQPSAVSGGNGAFHIEGMYSFFHVIYLRPPGAAQSVNGRICVDTSDGQHFSQELFMSGGNSVGSIPNASCDQLIIDCDLATNKCTGTVQ
jgi:hypothetical protein